MPSRQEKKVVCQHGKEACPEGAIALTSMRNREIVVLGPDKMGGFQIFERPPAVKTDKGRKTAADGWRTTTSQEDTPDEVPPRAGMPNRQGPGPGGGERPAVFRSTAHEVLFVLQATVATMSTTFLAGASTIVTASIGRELGMSQGQITWITAATSLTAGAFQLALGQLADLLGRRAMFISGLASFGALAAVTGFARNPFWMVVMTGCMGVGAAMMVPPAIGMLGACYNRPSKRKNLAFSAFSAGNPLGFALGSTLGGIAAEVFGWRASYFLIAILWSLFAVAAYWVVPRGVEAYGADEPLRSRLSGFGRRFDSVGALLTLLGTGMLAAGVTLGPEDGWDAPQVVAMLCVGGMLLVVFTLWETTFPSPLMPPRVWRDRTFACLMASLLLGYMAFQSAAFWLAFFLQRVQGRGPLDVAVHMLPQAVAGLAWNVVAGLALHRVNNTLLHAVGAVAYLTAALLLSFMRADSSYWAFAFPALVVNVVGADFQFNVANMYVMQSMPPNQQALAGGIFNTMVRLCQTLALGVSTAVYSSVEHGGGGGAGGDPMLKFTRAFQVSVAFAAAGLLFVPFIGLGTQGNEGDGPSPPVSGDGGDACGGSGETGVALPGETVGASDESVLAVKGTARGPLGRARVR